MTSTDLEPRRPGAVRTPDNISQATAVEQARAVAQVQAAVVVAQQNPRDMSRAEAEMRDVCGRLALANRAFYAVRNRGNGPSVHLARELARIFRNLDYGVHELRRDDEAGESEVQAFAWDQEANVKSTRTFVVPHARMKDGKRQKLIDLGDIYLSNQNIGARAVRECIFALLPSWFSEDAQDLCRATLEKGEGKPLADRIAAMVPRFAEQGVTLAQLETKIGRKQPNWTAQDVAEMAIAYTSITRDGISKDELFPTERVTAAEIAKQQTTNTEAGKNATPPADPITKAQSTKLHAVLGELGITDRIEKLRIVRAIMQRSALDSTSELSKDDAVTLLDTLESIAKRDDPKGNLDFIVEAAESNGGEDQ